MGMQRIRKGVFYDLYPVAYVEGANAYLILGGSAREGEVDFGYGRTMSVPDDSELLCDVFKTGNGGRRISLHPLDFAHAEGPIKVAPTLRKLGISCRAHADYDEGCRSAGATPRTWQDAFLHQEGIACENGMFIQIWFDAWKTWRFILEFGPEGWLTIDGKPIRNVSDKDLGIRRNLYRDEAAFIEGLLGMPSSWSASAFKKELLLHMDERDVSNLEFLIGEERIGAGELLGR